MAEHNNSRLLDGGDDSMGMTDNQYKGMLLDQLEDWSRSPGSGGQGREHRNPGKGRETNSQNQ